MAECTGPAWGTGPEPRLRSLGATLAHFRTHAYVRATACSRALTPPSGSQGQNGLMSPNTPLAHARTQPGSHPDLRLAADWERRLEAVTDPIRRLLLDVVAAGGPALADHFYGDMLEDPRAARFLSPDQVRERLKPSLQRWLRQLLAARTTDLAGLQATQQHVGQVHARINIPVDLVSRGARRLKDNLHAGIRARAPDETLALEAVICADDLIDIALETMTRAYSQSRDVAGQLDGSFRLFSLIQNIGTERERQRALLLAWENTLLYALAGDQPALPQPLLLSRSEFGLWFLHKGLASFGDIAETREVTRHAERIDALLQERLPTATSATDRRTLLDDVRAIADTIRALIAMMFDGIGDLESGRDALTALLNRRFLPTILRREISLQANTGRQFALLMIDLDHFKAINDEHGHEAGDLALKHVAALLVDNTRGSDYLFRYGGEEFVVVLGSASRSDAVSLAEGLRRAIAETPLRLRDGHMLPITASIGIAVQDGHPDYERLLARADAAMYQAKRSGRDRVVLASDTMPDPPGARLLKP